MGLNRCIFTGRLTNEPELKRTEKGTAVCSFSIAINEGYGEQKKVTYPKISVWGKQAEYVEKYGKKGMLAEIIARYSQGTYQNNHGQTVHTHEFVADDVQLVFEKANAATQNSNQVNSSANVSQSVVDSNPFEQEFNFNDEMDYPF